MLTLDSGGVSLSRSALGDSVQTIWLVGRHREKIFSHSILKRSFYTRYYSALLRASGTTQHVCSGVPF